MHELTHITVLIVANHFHTIGQIVHIDEGRIGLKAIATWMTAAYILISLIVAAIVVVVMIGSQRVVVVVVVAIIIAGGYCGLHGRHIAGAGAGAVAVTTNRRYFFANLRRC